MKIENRQRWLVILAGTVVLLLILEQVVYTPLVKNWETRSAAITLLKKNITAGRTLIERAPRINAQWAQMKNESLPKDQAQAEQELISAFDNWGRSANVELGSIKPTWKRGTTDKYSVLECRVDASGGLSSLTRFLYEVERSPIALRIETLELVCRDEQGTRLSLGLTVTGLRLSPLEGKQ